MPGSYLFDPNVYMAPCHDQLESTIEKKQKENAGNEDYSLLRGCLNCLEHAANEDCGVLRECLHCLERVNQTRSPPIMMLTFTVLAVCSVSSRPLQWVLSRAYSQTNL